MINNRNQAGAGFSAGSGFAMREWEEQFKVFLRARGLTFTPERRVVLEEIFADHGHFDVETLHDRLRRRGSRISIATIYRLIPLLTESGMIRRAIPRNGHPTYEHLFGHRPHHHLTCVRCGKVVEFGGESVEKSLDKICTRHGFAPFEYRLGVRGICAACRKEEER
jgi:Fur family transcriptional regulator, ferric uptake regulator